MSRPAWTERQAHRVRISQRTAVWTAALLLLGACGGGGDGAGGDSATGPANASSTPVNLPAATVPPELPGWQLVWNDEFDTPGLPDPSKWDHDTEYNQRGWWNAELQYYSRNRSENARVADGTLIITARQERLTQMADYGGQNYSSARLMTRGRASWTYGRFEVRAKLPCTLGTWPAIWMLGTGGVWPNDGEIDIMEQKGFSVQDKQQVLGTVHTLAQNGGAGPSGTRNLANACTDFNTYHLEWDASRILIGVNGQQVLSYPKPLNAGYDRWPFDRPQYLLLNVAVGGNLGGPVDNRNLPASMVVDWVRVYTKR